MEAIIVGILADWARQSNPGLFAEKVILVGIAFVMFRMFVLKDVKSHMERIEKELGEIKSAIIKTDKSLVVLEYNHAKEITAVKKDVELLKKFLPTAVGGANQ